MRIYVFGFFVPMTMDLEVSDDAVAWTPVVSDWTVTQGDVWVERTFTGVNGRYLRVYQTASAMNYGGLIELEVAAGIA